MKKIKYLLFSLIISVAGSLLFNGCIGDNLQDQRQNETGRIYMLQARKNPVNYPLITGIDSTQVITYSAAYAGAKTRDQDVQVSFSVNPSLVDSFNTKHATSYPILPENSYKLSKKEATIQAGEKSSSPLKLKINSNKIVQGKKYLLPITRKVNSDGVQVYKKLQTTYFIFPVHKYSLVPADHNYTSVFADDALNPDYLYFVGYSKYKEDQLVWKYDLQEDTLVDGFPKKVSDVFKLPYPQKIPHIGTVVWLKFTQFTPSFQAFFFGNGYYYRYNMKTKQAGDLHPITDLSTVKWPPDNFPKYIACGFYEHKRNGNYLFNKFYEKVHLGPLRAWFYPSTGHNLPGPWKAIPQSFVDRGFSGAYYDLSSKTVHFYSGNEFVVMNANDLTSIGSIQEIKDGYQGL
jgi:hypothetical protein